MKSNMKLVPQVRCGIPEGAVCDLETETLIIAELIRPVSHLLA